jgi:hypothetical protein
MLRFVVIGGLVLGLGVIPKLETHMKRDYLLYLCVCTILS